MLLDGNIRSALLVIGIAVYSSLWFRKEQDIIRSCALRLYNSGQFKGTPAHTYLREVSINGIPNFSAMLQKSGLCWDEGVQ